LELKIEKKDDRKLRATTPDENVLKADPECQKFSNTRTYFYVSEAVAAQPIGLHTYPLGLR
jgi:hypothetical protein